jgi:hypothetical protein
MRVGFLGLLTLLFIGLKLAGKIDWSWWWVLSPSIASIALAALVWGVYVYGDRFSRAARRRLGK